MLQLHKNTWFWTLMILTLFALNTFVLNEYLVRYTSFEFMSVIYILLRLFAFIFLAFALSYYCERKRLQVISQVLLVAFIDQCVFKFFIMRRMLQLDPSLSPEASQSASAIFFTLAASFIAFMPIVILISFFGYYLPKLKEEWQKSKTPKQSSP